jgi:hypothetical protein
VEDLERSDDDLQAVLSGGLLLNNLESKIEKNVLMDIGSMGTVFLSKYL